MNVQSVWCATARASSVFPVPGGPYSSTPFQRNMAKCDQWAAASATFQATHKYMDNESYLGLRNAQAVKKLGMFDGQLNHLAIEWD